MCTLYIITPIPANAKHLYSICTMLDQRRRRWAVVVQMLYNYFVFAGIIVIIPDGHKHAGNIGLQR